MLFSVRNLSLLRKLSTSNFSSFKSVSTHIAVNSNISTSCLNYYPFVSSKLLQSCESLNQFQQIRNVNVHHVNRPNPATYKKNCFFKVHYPEDGKYTIKRLKLTKLGGRDPDTGRVIFGKVGGGHKRYFRWVLYDRLPPGSKDPLEERIFHVQYNPTTTCKIALVGHEDKLRFILATSSMKAGDLIMSTRELPRIPVRPKEGDAHPVGALPDGTVICCVEFLPHGSCFKVNGGTSAVILRRENDRVVVQSSSLQEFALDPRCMAVVGECSVRNKPMRPIGSPQRLRWLGKRPGSGLWHRKDGRYGRKIKTKGPPIVPQPEKPEPRKLQLYLPGEMPSKKIIPSTLKNK